MDNTRSDARTRAPKVLVVSALPYIFSAKLVLGLRQVGFAVGVVCPSHGHPIHRLRHPPELFSLGVAGANSLGPFGARARVVTAIERFAPDIVVPCDDYAAQILHRIAFSAPSGTRRLLETSLGRIEAYPVLESRTAQVSLARRRNIRTPRFKVVESEVSLREALREVRLPAFLKLDDSWAGQGVRKISDSAGAYRAWRELSNQHSLIQALKNIRSMGVRHALAGIRNARPSIHLQAAAVGQAANRTALCRNGEVIDGFSVVAVQTTSQTGPASVLRVIDNAEMSTAVDVLARELGLSGFVGFDFVLSDRGEAYFLEINARATLAATLLFARSPDLLGLLFQTMTVRADAPNRCGAGDTIALFPDEMLRDETSPFLASAYHDMPADEPGLVEFGLQQRQGNARAKPSS